MSMKTAKTERTESKKHDEYLLQSNIALISENNELIEKKAHSRKLSQLSNPSNRERELIFSHKVKSAHRNNSKPVKRQKCSSKNKSKITDADTVKTNVKTIETLRKKPLLTSPLKLNLKNMEDDKKLRRKHKLKLDSMKNKKPIKLSKSGRFHADYEDENTTINRFESYTQHTCPHNDEDQGPIITDEHRDTRAYGRMNSVDCVGSLQKLYQHCAGVLSSYQKRIQNLNRENSKLKHENRKLRQGSKNK